MKPKTYHLPSLVAAIAALSSACTIQDSASLNETKQAPTFDLTSPLQQTIRSNGIKQLICILERGTILGHKTGDTLGVEQYDSTGSLVDRRIFTFFGAHMRNIYDSQGFLKYTTTTTDYNSEFFVSTFIDTCKRTLYQKWFDQLTDYPTIVTHFNEKGKSDSSYSAYYHQGWPVRYKEYFTYQNDLLAKTVKVIIDTAEAYNHGRPKVDTTTYFYDGTVLKTIHSYQILMKGRTRTTTDSFNKGIPELRTTLFNNDTIVEKIVTLK